MWPGALQSPELNMRTNLDTSIVETWQSPIRYGGHIRWGKFPTKAEASQIGKCH